MKTLKSQHGVAMILELILVAVVVAAGVLAYTNWQANQTKVKEAQTSSAKKTTTDPYAGWKTITTGNEKLTFKYPAAWTVVTNSSDAGTSQMPARDNVKLKGPNGLTISMSIGLDGIGGACEECRVVSADPIIFLGKAAFMNYGWHVNGAADMIDSILVAGQADCVGLCGFDTKNIKIPGYNTATAMLFSASFLASDGSPVPYKLAAYKANPDVATAKKIFESLTY